MFAKLSLILQLLPLLINVIKAVEAAIPAGGKGREKLEAIKGVLVASDSNVSSVWTTLEAVISVLVGLFNNTGAFTRTGGTPPNPDVGNPAA